MGSFSFFGKGKKKGADMPSPDSLGGMDLPPPPIPKGDSGFEISSFDDNSAGKDIALPELGSEKTTIPEKGNAQFSGLDKDWLDFAKNAAGQMTDKEETAPAARQAPSQMPTAQQRAMPQRAMNMAVNGPILIEMDTYSGFLDEINVLNVKLHLIDEMVVKMGPLREKEGIEFKRWHQGFDDIRKKLLYIDDALFESGR
jgi:hypothetical protein